MTVSEGERDSVSLSVDEGPGAREKEEIVIRRWRKKAKGRPMRWRILRDVVAVLALDWMNTSQMQIAMRRLYALKNSTTRDILGELEEEKSIKQSKDPDGVYAWEATPSGVAFWVGRTKDIPASIVRVASTSRNVNTLEV